MSEFVIQRWIEKVKKIKFIPFSDGVDSTETVSSRENLTYFLSILIVFFSKLVNFTTIAHCKQALLNSKI